MANPYLAPSRIRRRRAGAALLLWAACLRGAYAGDGFIEKRSLGAYVGGGLGLYGSSENWQKEAACARDLGIGLVRFNSDCWDVLEPQAGRYRWQTLDERVDLLRKQGLDIVFILPISAVWNSSADAAAPVVRARVGRTHFPARDLQALENLSYALSARYRGRIQFWEVWNEPDFEDFWKGRPDPEEYFRVLAAASRGLRRGNPECSILIGGLARPSQTGFLDAVLKQGGGRLFDIMNIHLYPQAVRDRSRTVADVSRRLRARGTPKPVWITEISTTPEYFASADREAEEARKADFLVKEYAQAFAAGAERIIWHSLRACGRDTGLNRDFDFGLMKADYTPLPAYAAYRFFIRKIVGTRPTVPAFRVPPPAMVTAFQGEGRSVWIAWLPRGRRETTLPIPARITGAWDVLGRPVPWTAGRRGGLRIYLSESPVYIEAAGDSARALQKAH